MAFQCEFPPEMQESSSCSVFSKTLGFSRIFYLFLSFLLFFEKVCNGTSQHGFNLQFSITNNGEYLFLYLFVVFLFLFLFFRCLLNISLLFSLFLCFFMMEFRECKESCCRQLSYKYPLPTCNLSFHSLGDVFQRGNILNFDEI